MLSEYAITELSTVKDELGITSSSEDAFIERLIHSYSDLLRRATDREFYYKTGHTESIKSHGDTQLMINDHRPIDSISSITDPDGDTVDSSAYEIEDSHEGVIRLKEDFWQNTGVSIHRAAPHTKYHEKTFDVTYSGGWNTPPQASPGPDDLPMHIEEAIISSVVTRYLSKGQKGNIKSESLGPASVSYGSTSQTVLGQNVTESLKTVVQRYRDRSVL